MLKINDIIEIDIKAYGSGGEGIAEYDRGIVFVERTAVGDTVRAKVFFVKKNVAYARPIKLIKAGSGRAEPPCPVFGRCGGCQLQHLSYEEQLKFKCGLVRKNLEKIGGISVEVPEVVPSEKKWNYRNKMSMPVGFFGGKIAAGLYKGNTHEIIPVADCPLLGNWSGEVIKTVCGFLNEQSLSAYDEKSGKGLVRHIVGRFVDGQLLVTLVINGDFLPNAEILQKKLEEKFDKIGFFVNINKKSTNVIFGEKTAHIGGIEKIQGAQMGVAYSLRPQSFYQVNDAIKDKIYAKVKELLSGGGVEILIDAYSGAGILSGALHSEKYRTYAIEIEPAAVNDAEEMKKANGLKNLTNICGDVETELAKIVEENPGKNIALVVDPPRKGLGAKVVETILKAKPRQIIYISCDSATLARDLKLLGAACEIRCATNATEFARISEQNNQDADKTKIEANEPTASAIKSTQHYKITHIQPYDMFPQTRHVECVVLMSRMEK